MREFLIGAGGGLLIGATGAGAGSLITPLLILIGHSASSSVAAGVATMFVSKLSGSVVHRRLGHWPGPAAWFVIGGGAAGSLAVWAAFAATAWRVPASDAPLRLLVGLTLLASAAATTLASRRDLAPVPAPDCRARLFGTGFVVAPLVALTSAGSGSILVPLLLLSTAWRVPELAATSNWFGLVAGGAGSLLHLHVHTLDVRLFGAVAAGVLPGVVAGALLSRVISRQWLTYFIYILTLFLAIALLS
jgi:uncharacterized membrane protein YfcA